MKKLTLVNLTGQGIIIGFEEVKKGQPLEPIIFEPHGEMKVTEKKAEEIMAKSPNIIVKKEK